VLCCAAYIPHAFLIFTDESVSIVTSEQPWGNKKYSVGLILSALQPFLLIARKKNKK
jgi:hypothetical protein